MSDTGVATTKNDASTVLYKGESCLCADQVGIMMTKSFLSIIAGFIPPL
jgi:hypothetical protein